ncbi:MAG: ATP-dependent helicase [Nocardioidaceae bacterium]|nr:ATP-dependent helicase [Nocardioidaceae bacterium]
MSPRYVLRHAPARAAAPRLDASQRAVVDHRGGPLLVLAGPGTGKTTTLVEAVVDRVERRGLRADEVLVLTFGRKAADELRGRISARLGRTTAAPMATTFHAFCYALLRRFQDAEAFTSPLQLLSAPEQDVRIRELLKGSVRTGTIAWPSDMLPALGTRGMAEEVQRVLACARERGLEPTEVTMIGHQQRRPEWVAAGQFFAEYLDVLDAQNQLDYAELVHRAVLTARDPAVEEVLRREISLVVVDEYQDTDPAQVDLLRSIAGGGRDLIVVGDPDQSIYGFRGAEVRGLLRFPHDFRHADGRPAATYALRTTRRFGKRILRASRTLVARSGVPGGLDRATFEAFRQPRPVAPEYGDGDVRVQTYLSPAAEAEHIAALLRRAHLDDGLPWSTMAVLVRSGQSIPRLQRALVAADVPVEVAGDEVPLRSEPAVQVLLRALRLATTSEPLDASAAEGLLTSPLGAMDPGSVRRLARQLRRHDSEMSAGERLPRASGQLLAEALGDPAVLATVSGVEAQRALRMARLLGRARELAAQRAAPEEVVWAIWSGTSWPRRLRAQAERVGTAGRAAHRDLDAVCALFGLAARAQEQQRLPGLQQFLDEVDGQQIPAEPLAERGVRGDVVRLLTAHRAKGLEWRLVVVAGVQEGTWPDLRRRGSFLHADRLDRDGPLEPPTAAQLLAEERRLFYVAVTRARERLVVTAVASPADDGDQPSRFLHELGVEACGPLGRPSRPVSLRGVLAELRCIAETTDDPGVRAAAAARIARLARPVSGGAAPLACASPDSWWGTSDPTDTTTPVRPVDEPVALSGSALDGLASCPLRWFLAREAGGASTSTTAQGFGSLLHALAESVVTGETVADDVPLQRHLERMWDSLQFSAPWVSARERTEARTALRRFLAWHQADRDRRVLAAEHAFEVEVPVGGDSVLLRGFMDRVEVDAAGRVIVVDLKTVRTTPSGTAVRAHPQLGVYQVAVAAGAVDEVVGAPAVQGGAELVQLRHNAPRQDEGLPRVQRQEPPEGDAAPVHAQLAHAVSTVRGERFVATPGAACRYCEFRSCCPARPEGLTILAAPRNDACPDACPEAS